ncbi:MAG: AAA family ATPase [Actinobacteria bacterium]|nr:AAA family ATPase [Actinomycetota bacterium]
MARRPPRPAHGRPDRQRPRPLGRRGRQRADHPGRPGRGRAAGGQADPLPGQRRDRRRSRRHHPQAACLTQGRARCGSPAARLAGRAEAGSPAGRVRLGDPPERAGLPAPRTRRHGRRRGAAQAARCRGARSAVRAARHRQDQPGRGGLPRPDHGRRRRRHHDRRLPGRVHPAPRQHVRVHLRPLIRAMLEGRVLFIDDATLISPAVLAVCYSVMDGRREVIVKAHKGETIKAERGFYVVAGHNPGVHGAILTEALSSRFAVQVKVSTDYDLARSLGIDSRAITAARNLTTRQANGEIGWAPQLGELLAFAKITTILGLDAAIANLAGVAPAEDRDVVAATLARTFGKTVTPLALGRQI